MKVIKKPCRWPTFIIVTLLLGVSVLSWVKFAKIFVDTLFLFTQAEVVDIDSEDKTLKEAIKKTTESNPEFSLFQTVDTYIDKFSSTWKVYKETDLSKIDSLATYYVTKEIISAQVLSGKDRWLFYKSRTDGDPIADYEGTNMYSPNEMDEILENVSEVQQELQKRGI